MPANSSMPARLTVAQAAARLGVKVETIYAYVSRGVLTSERAPGARSSTLDAAQVEQVALRGRPRRSTRSTTLDIEIRTSITEVAGGRVRYRGHDVATLAVERPFEDVAELLWLGALPPTGRAWRPWAPTPTEEPGPGTGPAPGAAVDRLRVLAATVALADPMRGDLRPVAVAACGRRVIAAMADGTGSVRAARVGALELPGRRLRSTVAGRLTAGLVRGAPRAGVVATVNAALVLLADHELATSTLAARVAASSRADPHGVIGAGLGPFSGSLHGTASREVRRLLDDASRDGVHAALRDTVRLHGRVPGLGHPLYPAGDPRASTMLAGVRDVGAGSEGLDLVERMLVEVERHTGIAPNVDFGLAALGHVVEMPADSGEAMFAIARTAGWLAHALEEYEETPLRFRPRALYIGPDPAR